MLKQLACFVTIRWVGIAALAGALCLTGSGCETQQQTGSGEPGSLANIQTARGRIGPAQMTPDQLQSEVDAYADRFVNAFAQASDSITRQKPDARNVLHTIKLATATGTYTIAAGPNPLVAMLDMVVQVTLLRHSLNTTLIPRLLDGEGGALNDVIDRYEQQAWLMAERALTEPQRVELRELINVWIEENPGQIYVAGVRLSDFARLRLTAERPAGSVFSLLRIDPFASLDPTTREIEEARMLAERVFYYSQRLPQLITWRVEQAYYTLLGAEEAETLLANIDSFSASSTNMAKTIEDLRTLIPQQTGEAVRAFSNALAEQREETVAALQSQQNEFTSLLDQTNLTIEKARGVTSDVQSTLRTAEDVGTKLQTASQAVGEAGRAWEGTFNAFGKATSPFAPKPGENPPASDAEPVAFEDIIAGIERTQQTAVELRLLLEELSAVSESDDLSRNVVESVDQTRRNMEDLTSYIMWRGIIVIGVIVVAAIVYRLISQSVATKQ